MHFTCLTRSFTNSREWMGNFHHWAIGKLNSMGSWCMKLSNSGWLVSDEIEFHGWLGKKKVPSSTPRCFFLE